jgi:hypothetical protein
MSNINEVAGSGFSALELGQQLILTATELTQRVLSEGRTRGLAEHQLSRTVLKEAFEIGPPTVPVDLQRTAQGVFTTGSIAVDALVMHGLLPETQKELEKDDIYSQLAERFKRIVGCPNQPLITTAFRQISEHAFVNGAYRETGRLKPILNIGYCLLPEDPSVSLEFDFSDFSFQVTCQGGYRRGVLYLSHNDDGRSVWNVFSGLPNDTVGNFSLQQELLLNRDTIGSLVETGKLDKEWAKQIGDTYIGWDEVLPLFEEIYGKYGEEAGDAFLLQILVQQKIRTGTTDQFTMPQLQGAIERATPEIINELNEWVEAGSPQDNSEDYKVLEEKIIAYGLEDLPYATEFMEANIQGALVAQFRRGYTPQEFIALASIRREKGEAAAAFEAQLNAANDEAIFNNIRSREDIVDSRHLYTAS